jgi:hypothetical protein
LTFRAARAWSSRIQLLWHRCRVQGSSSSSSQQLRKSSATWASLMLILQVSGPGTLFINKYIKISNLYNIYNYIYISYYIYNYTLGGLSATHTPVGNTPC